jgi:uncharacterized protein with PIN domain
MKMKTEVLAWIPKYENANRSTGMDPIVWKCKQKYWHGSQSMKMQTEVLAWVP